MRFKGLKAVLLLLPLGIGIGIAGGLVSGFFIDRWGIENSLTIGLILVTSSAFFYTYRTNKTTVKEMKKTRYAESIPIILIEVPSTKEETATVESNDIKLTNVGKGIATNVEMHYSWNKKNTDLGDINMNRSIEHKLLIAEKEEIKNMPENSCRIELKYKDIFGNRFMSWAYCNVIAQNDVKLHKWQYKAFLRE